MVGFSQRVFILVACCLVQRFEVSAYISNTTVQQPSPTSPAPPGLATANSSPSPSASYVNPLNIPESPPTPTHYTTPTFNIPSPASGSNGGDLKYLPLAVLAGIVTLALIGLGTFRQMRSQRLQVC